MTSVSIPYPPSANRLWRAVNGRQIKSAVYRSWCSEAALMLRAQRPATVAGAYHLSIVATPPDRRARDIDNLIKPISDALASAGIVANDSMARSVYAAWSPQDPIKGGLVTVEINPA